MQAAAGTQLLPSASVPTHISSPRLTSVEIPKLSLGLDPHSSLSLCLWLLKSLSVAAYWKTTDPESSQQLFFPLGPQHLGFDLVPATV